MQRGEKDVVEVEEEMMKVPASVDDPTLARTKNQMQVTNKRRRFDRKKKKEKRSRKVDAVGWRR